MSIDNRVGVTRVLAYSSSDSSDNKGIGRIKGRVVGEQTRGRESPQAPFLSETQWLLVTKYLEEQEAMTSERIRVCYSNAMSLLLEVEESQRKGIVGEERDAFLLSMERFRNVDFYRKRQDTKPSYFSLLKCWKGRTLDAARRISNLSGFSQGKRSEEEQPLFEMEE